MRRTVRSSWSFPGAGPEAVDAILADKRAWLEDTLAWAEAVASRPPALGLNRPGWVPIDGTWLRVVRVGGRRSGAQRSGGDLVVAGGPESVDAAIDRWYRREARRAIGGEVRRLAVLLGVHPGPISIRDPVTRWGSCSATGRMSFSWRLLLAPPAVLDYVVVHELCHLRHPDHSRRFWAMVAAARPDWREQVGWLERHGPELLAYRPSG